MPRRNNSREKVVSLGKRTHLSRVAPNSRDLLKDALPTKLHVRNNLRCILETAVERRNGTERPGFESLSIQGKDLPFFLFTQAA